MKSFGYLLLIFCIFLTHPKWSRAQQVQFPLQVLYEITCVPDSTQMTKVHNEMAELLVNDTIAVFRSMDKNLEAKARHELMNAGISPKPREGTIFDFEIILQGTDIRLLGPTVLRRNQVQYALGYEDTMTKFNWILHNETMEILGYTCQKATLDYGGRKWTAWFTVDIPIHYGPFKFGNLGGLILKMEDKSGEWKFNVQSINSDPHRISHFMLAFDKQAQIEYYDSAHYYLKKKQHFLTATDKAIAQGLRFRNKEAEERSRATLLRIYNQNSNWIELYYDQNGLSQE